MASEAEKARISPSLQSVTQEELGDQTALNTSHKSRYQRWAMSIKGLEARGIEPIPLEERLKTNPSATLHMLLMWFSMGMALNNMVVGSIGTLVMKLSFADAAICAIFGNLLGGLTFGYMSTWGPKSGNRTLIVTRYFMGYYPSKLCCLLNVLTNLGYGMMNCMIGGQLLSKISDGAVSVVVGIIIVALATWVMATFGMQIFHYYERYAWFPQLLVLCIITGSAGPEFDFTSASIGSPEEVNVKRLAFLSLCLSVALAWTPLAADYYVYYPPTISRWRVWSVTMTGGCLAMIITLLLGIGLGTGVASNSKWAAIYDGTPASLLMAGYDRLGGFGRFCAFINVVTVVSNNAPGSYSMAMNFQMLGNMWSKIPRPVFSVITTVAYAACAIGGRDFLYEIFKSLLPLIGYWVVIWFTIVVEENLLFRHDKGYDWSVWNCREKLPMGMAAGFAFLVGWVGAIVGMDQVYYTGPIANAIVGGCDLGVWLGFGFTAVAFPPLRILELKVIGR